LDKPFSKKPTFMSIALRNACCRTQPTLTSQSYKSNEHSRTADDERGG
jgi:hypothetical protein